MTKRAVIAKLIELCAQRGYELNAVFDGEEWEDTTDPDYVLDLVLDLDISRLQVVHADGRMISWLIVLDCEPDEIVADAAFSPTAREDVDALWVDLERHFDKVRAWRPLVLRLQALLRSSVRRPPAWWVGSETDPVEADAIRLPAEFVEFVNHRFSHL